LAVGSAFSVCFHPHRLCDALRRPMSMTRRANDDDAVMGDHAARAWYRVLFLARHLATGVDHGGNTQPAMPAHAVPPFAAHKPPHRMQAA
jgi:hypothetical protein